MKVCKICGEIGLMHSRVMTEGTAQPTVRMYRTLAHPALELIRFQGSYATPGELVGDNMDKTLEEAGIAEVGSR